VRLTYFHDNRLLTGLYKQETEIRRRKDECCIKKQTDIDRHSTVTASTSSQPLDSPHFSLPTTFKVGIKYLIQYPKQNTGQLAMF
jgi:hypothetical protein